MVNVVIAGGREFEDEGFLFAAMDSVKYLYSNKPIMVVSGGARAADTLGEKWAAFHGFEVDRHKPDYKQHGRYHAPMIRNEEMGEVGDILCAFWDGKSRGTRHMISVGMRRGLEVHVFRYECSKD